MALFRDDWQRVELVLPDDVVRLREGDSIRTADKTLDRRHEIFHRRGGIHTAGAVIAARHDTEQPARRRTVMRDRDGGVPGARFERHNVRHRIERGDVVITPDKAGLGFFYRSHHRSLGFDGLGDKQK